MRVQRPDLVLLDLMLPGLDGASVCRALRTFSDMTIIMLTARLEEAGRLIGLDAAPTNKSARRRSARAT